MLDPLLPDDYYPAEDLESRADQQMIDTRRRRLDRKKLQSRQHLILNRRQRRRLVKVNGGFKARNRGVWPRANAHARRMRSDQQK